MEQRVRQNIDNISRQILKNLPFYRLKDLIKAIRACKTAAEERAVIQKESASIRTSFKEENNDARHSNVSKLLYIHMLGYPAHFGQMECLKLVASPKFTDKRLGYLGIMLLLDENQEVLTLVTNSLKNDLSHPNMYIVGLALCTMGNISSPEMARDLCNEVESLMGSTNTYIRKKASAALCAVRIIRRVPDLAENFASKCKSLINDRNHGVLIAGVTLMYEMCCVSEDSRIAFRRVVPVLVRLQKNLVTAGFSPEHDVTGVTDPFLQVKVLQLLCKLAHDDAETCEQLNDALAQVATNTESTKNVGNAILYETVVTIMECQASDQGLRVMAVNILGKFLSNRDNNIRYVALETLLKTVNIDTAAVQRHRNIILDCLRDGDISIRRRALELSFALINESNVRVLTRELLAFLEVADNEFKQNMTTKLCLAADRFAPNKRWHIDTVLRVLKLAGNYIREEILAGFIRLVAQSSDLHQYAVQKLYTALKNDISQEALVLAGVWVIGEFGDVLLEAGNFEDDEKLVEVSPANVLSLIRSILSGPYVNQISREYCLTALMKLTSRFNDTVTTSEAKALIGEYSGSLEVEIQQRAAEYTNLFNFDNIRPAVLERMPVPEGRVGAVESTVGAAASPASERRSRTGPTDEDLLLDLMGVGTAAGGSSSTADILSSPPSAKSTSNNLDLLADIFGGSNPVPPQPQDESAIMTPKPVSNGLDSLFDAPKSTSSTPRLFSPQKVSSPLEDLDASTTPAPSGHIAYHDGGLMILFRPSRDAQNPNIVNIEIVFHNDGSCGELRDVGLQVAVPKSQRLQMLPASGTTVAVGVEQKQIMRVANPSNTPLKFRLRITYKSSANPQGVEKVAEFGGFAAGAY
ncbi:AP-1 complex subunit gamma-1 [Bifiguratus adelaidae]|uniref:AP-1 complex subunit gamma n=1 Tax=Bifiguratus adelaidae TaxID=1938954 RepID=A0A261Y811_9FUNG|nr:AP-1 complex subunit gamma-1 [Bifiguratus adelaidae]